MRYINLSLLLLAPAALIAQAPEKAPSAIGTVTAVSGTTITFTARAGATTALTTPDTPVLQVAPGTTDIKSATPSAFDQIAVGDRVLVTGKLGDTPTALTAARVILIKSSAIVARQATQQADWQKRGTSGLVKSVDHSAFMVSEGPRTLTVITTPTTIFRRYAGDSVKFTDATPGTLSQVQAGDQISVRGDKSAEGDSVNAEEVVTGTFQNLSGIITAADPAANTLTLRDLTTRQTVVVHVTPNSDLRMLPPQAASAFANRNNASAVPTGPAGAPAHGGQGGYASGASSGPAGAGRAAAGRAGMDLSRMLPRLPTQTVADIKPGEAVMIVASHPAGADLTAITLLTGVEQILSSTTAGSAPITLSPWNLGAPEGAGGGGGAQ